MTQIPPNGRDAEKSSHRLQSGLNGRGYDILVPTRMSRWKLGSMVRINGLFQPILINGVFLGVITH